MVKMLNVLVNTISTHIFSAKILAYMPHLMIKVLLIHYVDLHIELQPNQPAVHICLSFLG